jgi:uncharacterized protein (DUF2236 family)
MIGIFSTTIIHTNPQPMRAGYPVQQVPSQPMSDQGLFGPDSVTWRVNREGVLLVGGGTALILQLAHPLVAAGVSQHSNFREDPWGRLYRTLDLTTKIMFGSTATADEAAARIRHTHGRVRGQSSEGGGAYPAGTPYDARTHELVMWVHATLIHVSLLVYARYVKPLTIGEQRTYYEEQKLVGEKFGVPVEHQPADFAAFNEYFHDMLASDRIATTDALLDVVDAVMHPELPLVARPVMEAMNLATVGLLPESLRTELGLPWGANRRRLFEASRLLLSAALPVLPKLVREFPPARSADRRVSRLAAA